jgi:hypothetical protein
VATVVPVTTLAEASLTDAERRALDRAVGDLRQKYGERLQRREIRSFFIQEVDRDKIVLHGEP